MHKRINAIHKLPSRSSGTTSRPKPATIIIQFVSQKKRNELLAKRRMLKGTKSFVLTEQLTAKKSALLKKAQDLVVARKFESAWSHEGRILVKTPTSRTVVATQTTDFDTLQ